MGNKSGPLSKQVALARALESIEQSRRASREIDFWRIARLPRRLVRKLAANLARPADRASETARLAGGGAI
jgi:hypothetical protein